MLIISCNVWKLALGKGLEVFEEFGWLCINVYHTRVARTGSPLPDVHKIWDRSPFTTLRNDGTGFEGMKM